ncbi:MAG: glycosyl hydrolase family 18 protein, partial [Oscillospiraceae bacterium]
VVPAKAGVKDFKVVGYYPSWQPDKVKNIQYDNLTHINYAFAIPKSDGTLMPLENASSAQKIIKSAHKKGVKVLLAVGGWSYKETPLEPTFKEATNSPEKVKKFTKSIIDMVKKYGFDGVDMDWEHPRYQDVTSEQYTQLMQSLSVELKKDNLLLTSAVLSGVTADGTVLYDAAAHTDAVIKAVDWFNVMAYDGGDGDRHSSYDFAVNCGNYWKNTRKMPANKVVLGVPFYGRPSWKTYEEILAANPDAYKTDVSNINGIEAHYNGIPTIQKKTKWACENVGGVMIWEISQDTTAKDKSLLTAIAETIKKNKK